MRRKPKLLAVAAISSVAAVALLSTGCRTLGGGGVVCETPAEADLADLDDLIAEGLYPGAARIIQGYTALCCELDAQEGFDASWCEVE